MKNVTKRPLDDVLDAIRDSRGNVSAVARRLGVTRRTVYNYLAAWKGAQEALDDERAQVGDAIETTLLSMALGKRSSDGSHWIVEPNVACLIFAAKSHPEMRKRGWRESADLRISGNFDPSKYSDDELQRIAEGGGGT